MTKPTAELLRDAGIEAREDCPLAPHTSFRIGGAARLAVFPKSSVQMLDVLRSLRDSGERILVLGNGSNVLVSDEGFDGVAVILTGMKEVTIDADSGLVRADSGVSLTSLAMQAAKASLTGLEFAYGIPGSVGGGIYMNAGAYGGELANVVVRSEWYDLDSGETGVFEGAEHDFGYRKSAFMYSRKIILSTVLKLKKGNPTEIEVVMSDLMSRRRDKQPLEYPSAGSVFKRGEDFITAALIEQAGLKGRQIGGARVSDKHAGFIVNVGGATANDVLELIEVVRGELLTRFGKTVECEIRIVR